MTASRLVLCAVILLIAAVGIVTALHPVGVSSKARELVGLIVHPVRAHVSVGDQLPQLQVTSLSGERASIKPQHGHVLVINVFATWCPPCINETPALAQLSAAMAGKPVDIVGIDQQEYPSTVLQFAQRYRLSFPLYIDNQHVTGRKLGAYDIPRTFIVDDRGTVLANVAGPLTLDEMEQLVQGGLDHLAHRS